MQVGGNLIHPLLYAHCSSRCLCARIIIYTVQIQAGCRCGAKMQGQLYLALRLFHGTAEYLPAKYIAYNDRPRASIGLPEGKYSLASRNGIGVQTRFHLLAVLAD